jgi:MFS family permease
MDRFGRVPVLVAGFGVGAAGCGLAGLGSARDSALAVLAGLVGVGTANAATVLARTAAGDATAAVLFGLGLGWNLSFVAATAVLADRTKPWERGSLLGFNDLLSSATGAGLTVLGGLVVTAAGVASLTIGAVALLVAPAVFILLASDSSRRSS